MDSQMEYKLTDVLTREEIDECKAVALRRVDEHIGDAKHKVRGSLNSNGGPASLDARKRPLRLKQGLMGALGECIASKFSKCKWTKESGQYKGNTNPDLGPLYCGKRVICEVRTRGEDTCMYRPQHDRRRPDVLFISITNMPFGPFRIGHAFFRDLTPLVDAHPEWKRCANDPYPFYAIPFEHFSEDFSEFGV